MDKVELKRKVAEYTYRLMHWGNRRVPPGLRTLVEGAMQAASDRAEEMAREMG